jgi:hypothetical protein
MLNFVKKLLALALVLGVAAVAFAQTGNKAENRPWKRISHSTARAALYTSATGFEPRAIPGFPARVAGSP